MYAHRSIAGAFLVFIAPLDAMAARLPDPPDADAPRACLARAAEVADASGVRHAVWWRIPAAACERTGSDVALWIDGTPVCWSAGAAPDRVLAMNVSEQDEPSAARRRDEVSPTPVDASQETPAYALLVAALCAAGLMAQRRIPEPAVR